MFKLLLLERDLGADWNIPVIKNGIPGIPGTEVHQCKGVSLIAVIVL